MSSDIYLDFLILCKQAFEKGVRPATPDAASNKTFQDIVLKSKEFFERNMYVEFETFFQEEKYLVPLWVAHMLLQFGEPNDKLKAESLRMISYYSKNAIDPVVANEEADWLKYNSERFFM